MQSVDKSVLFDSRRPVVPRLEYHLVRWREPRDHRWNGSSRATTAGDRDRQNRFTSERAFISAAEELLRNIRKGFVSATLPNGRVLNEAAIRALVANTSVNR
jgi:hypothetical protein